MPTLLARTVLDAEVSRLSIDYLDQPSGRAPALVCFSGCTYCSIAKGEETKGALCVDSQICRHDPAHVVSGTECAIDVMEAALQPGMGQNVT